MVFVTGGSGLIGSFLIAELIRRGHAVKALYRGQVPELEERDAVTWVEGDVLDISLLREHISGASFVFHCAGLVSYAPQDAQLLQQINVEGTANVVNACLENPEVKLCHVSSVAAIGRPKGAVQPDEDTKWDEAAEHSAYASSKYYAEQEVWRGMAEGLKAVIVNPSVVLGPANWERSSTQLFRYVYKERPFYTAGSANFVDVRDVVQAMIELTFSAVQGQRFILNAGILDYEAFFKRISENWQKKAPYLKVPAPLAELLWRLEYVRSLLTGKRPLITKETARVTRKRHTFNNSKIKKTLPFTFRPVQETIDWCCAELAVRYGIPAKS